MDGAEFVKRVKRYAKRQGLEVRHDLQQGKGSHSRLYLGDRFTTVKSGEIPRGTLRAMLKQLGIDKDRF